MLELRTITLLQPPRVVFGPGCATGAVAGLVRPGRDRILIFTSPSVRAHAQRLATAAGASGQAETIGDIPPEPTTAVCEALRERARRFQPDVVLAVGGGSVLDVAKLVAALHDREEPLSTFYGEGLVADRRTTLICVATTAGTGSEVSPNALLYDEPSRSKKAIIGAALVPDVAVVDPELMCSLPPELTASTGLDALTHCLETYANRAAHPAVDPRSLEGVRLIAAHLASAVADGSNLAARGAVALGSLYGGLALGPVNTAGVHALAYPLSGEFHLAHGLSVALLLPHVIRFNVPAMPTRYAALARALGAEASASDQAAAAQCADRLEALLAACKIPRGLRAHGIPSEALPRLADDALRVTRLLKNNPREIGRADALEIYRAAY